MKKATVRHKTLTFPQYNFDMIDEKEALLERIELHRHLFGKPERWVRAKVEAPITEAVEWIYPDGYYDEADVLETEDRPKPLSSHPIEENKVFVPEENLETWVKLKAEYTIEIEDYRPVPQSLTPRQARLALNHYNLRQAVETAVAGADQNTKDEWEFANEIRRDWKTLKDLAQILDLTESELDEIFIYGGAL